MRPSVPGYEVKPENRPTGKAWNFFYSLLPQVNSGDRILVDPVEFRLRPNESRDFPVVMHQDSEFFDHFIRFEVANEYALDPLTGGVYATPGNLLNGLATTFRAQLNPGDVIYIDNAGIDVQYYTVSEILSDTLLRVAEHIPAAIGSIVDDLVFGKMQTRNTPMVPWPGVDVHRYRLTGTISAAGAATAIVGVGTLFLTELVVGDKIRVMDDTGAEQFLIISAIADNLNASIRGATAGAITAQPILKFYTDYTDIEFSIFAVGGGGQRLLGGGPVLSNQGVNGAGNPEIVPGGGGFAAIRRPYLYGKAGAAMVRVRNIRSDARRVHSHLFGPRIRI